MACYGDLCRHVERVFFRFFVIILNRSTMWCPCSVCKYVYAFRTHFVHISYTFRGFYSSDTVSFAGFKLSDFTLAEVYDYSGLGVAYRVGKFDGILGLGFDRISVGGVPTIMKALVASGRLCNLLWGPLPSC